MPVVVFRNDTGNFSRIPAPEGLENSEGWWWKLTAFDFDRDGDDDYFAGNLGFNVKYKASVTEPFEIFASDFDGGGNVDIALGWYFEHRLYPVRNRAASYRQIPDIKRRVPTTEIFAGMTLPEIYGKEILDSSLHYSAYTFANTYIENLGNGKFRMDALPNDAQFSNITSMVVTDADEDGYHDLVMAGNLYAMEIETARIDAGTGVWMRNNRRGGFDTIRGVNCGLFADGDIKDATIVNTSNGRLIVFVRNNDYVKVIRIHRKKPKG
jgi:hypothetical protein